MDPTDEALNAALGRLPRRDAPERLKRDLAERFLEKKRVDVGRLGRLFGAGVLGAALAAAALLFWQRRDAADRLFAEAVNDHLRLLYAAQPVEIASGGVHQVKPWFAGRVDFAPALGFGGDDAFPLQGGAVALFLDRKAAAFEFKRRLHPITLFVFRAGGLPWPSATLKLGTTPAAMTTERGFHVVLWRRDDLGYALVSDLDPAELVTLGTKIAAD